MEEKPETRGKAGQSHYPWDTMEVGKTFFWLEPHSEEEAKRCLGRIQYYQEKLGRKFSMRSIDGRIKVWRDA